MRLVVLEAPAVYRSPARPHVGRHPYFHRIRWSPLFRRHGAIGGLPVETFWGLGGLLSKGGSYPPPDGYRSHEVMSDTGLNGRPGVLTTCIILRYL